jgi:pyruvate/2-oxoglutarate dehydrogenase complex dihydrolipoamide acyltransferase (E2) component
MLAEALGAEGDEFAPGAVIGLVTDEREVTSLEAHATAVSALDLGLAEPERAAASPAARRLARELGVHLGRITGTGPGGRITLEDVAAAAPPERVIPPPLTAPEAPMNGAAVPAPVAAHAAAAAAPPPATPPLAASPIPAPPEAGVPPHLAPARRTIFARMTQIAHIPLAQVETTARVDALHAMLRRRGDVGWTAFVVFAAARLLLDYPVLRTDARTGAPHSSCDVGVAADTAQGLVVPVVRGAATRTLRGIQDEIARLAGAAREGRLVGSDVGEAAFTVSNVGPQGIERVVPLVDSPQTAILGVGAAGRRPAVITEPGAEHDVVAPAWMLTLVLSFDHRFIDGAPAARFLAALSAALTDPGLLL